MTENSEHERPRKSKDPGVPISAPRFWHGMRFGSYLKLLTLGKFRIHFLGMGMCLAIFFFSMANTVLSWIQTLIWGPTIRDTKVAPPVFIIGHWRTGTTLLHELVSLDPQFAAPTTLQCFSPNHFLISERGLRPIVSMVMPKTRPMDNMPSGTQRPQEDEFAVCGLGAPSPYLSMAFPNQPHVFQELIDMENVNPKDLEKFGNALEYFFKCLTAKYGKTLLLKSPTHTGRVEYLRKKFPGARFIHVTRDPKDVIPSTIRLWKKLDQVNGFQVPNYSREQSEEYVLKTFEKMYRAFFKQTTESDEDLVTIKYEDLVADPVTHLQNAYQQLGLSGFEFVAPRIKEYMQAQGDYKKNEHQLRPELAAAMNTSCKSYREKFEYPQ